MTDFRVDSGPEGQEVELPALELIEKLGYTYKNHFELEANRTDYHEALLYDRLERAVQEINGLDDDETREAMSQIHESNFPPRLNPVEANERVRIKLLNISQTDALDTPIQVNSIDEKGNPIKKDVVFFDFENVGTDKDKNDYLVTNQFKLVGLKGEIECDIVVFVNGIPLVLIECKKKDTIDPVQTAFDENLNRYQSKNSGFEKLFFYNHLIIATSKVKAECGTLQTEPSFFSKWTDCYPMTKEELRNLCGRTLYDQDILLAGILNKKNLLDMLENFVIYETKRNQRVKIVSKHQQLRGISKALEKFSEGTQPLNRGGVIWHTQGAGKSYSMVWFATQLIFKHNNPPMMIITDRKQLDEQITNNFKRAGYPNKVTRATSASHLAELLKNPKGDTIMTTLHKFGMKNDEIHTDQKIVVLVDEAHRTEYGTIALDMRTAMPNAIFYGFTGTPIAKGKRNTVDKFGSIIDTYTFQDAIRDGVTLPVKHHGLFSETYVEGEETLDEIFERVFADLDNDTKAKLKQQYGSKEAIHTSRERIKKVCDRILKHYNEYVKPDGFKAMIIAENRAAAVKYKKQLDKIGAPTSKIIMTSDKDEKDPLTGESWEDYYLDDTAKQNVTEKFQSPDDPIKILIVVNLLLTGFDCPILKVLYLDRTLKEHTLLQAIARVNRVYTKQKKSGLVVDFTGITKNLKKAFEMFEEVDVNAALDTLDTDIQNARACQQIILDDIAHLNGKEDSDIILEFESEQKRDQYKNDYKLFAKAVDELLPYKEADEFTKDLKRASEIQALLRAKYYGDKPRIKEFGAKVQQLIDDHVKTLGIKELTEPRLINDVNFGALKKNLDDTAQAAVLKGRIIAVIREGVNRNPGFYKKLSDRLNALIAEQTATRIKDAEFVKQCEIILENAVNGPKKIMADLKITNEFEFVIFENLSQHCKDEKICLDSAKTISRIIHEESETNDWREKKKSEDIMFLATLDNLPNNEFPEEIRTKLAEENVDLARRLL